jgi:uncharacterized repeat protein (TIGR04138 family)
MEGTQYFNAWFVCDSCAAILLEPSRKLQELAEKYGTVTLIPTLEEIIGKIVAEDSRFSTEAYDFVAEAAKAAFSELVLKRNAKPEGFSLETRKDNEALVEKFAYVEMSSKHLVVALQRLASERFGKCAADTFNLWGITCWQDFAEIVSGMQGKFYLFEGFVLNKEDFRSRGVLDDVFPES